MKIYIYISLASIITLILGLNTFWIGFHNIDLCHNERIIQDDVNKKFNKLNVSDYILREQKANGDVWTLSECYLDGLDAIERGLYVSMIGAFVLGLSYNLKRSK